MSNTRKQLRRGRWWLVVTMSILLLSGCFQTRASAPPPATAISSPTAGTARTGNSRVVPTRSPTGEATVSAAIPATPLPRPRGALPVSLHMPDLDLTIPVTPMGWRIVSMEGKTTTAWVVPDAGAGWHRDSARPGTRGNVVISGHQLLGEAAFAPLALGEVEVGQEILLSDVGERTFVYRVSEITEPIPISTDLEDEVAAAETYTVQDGTAKLTLVTGWPDFSTTHRLIVVAEYVGVARP